MSPARSALLFLFGLGVGAIGGSVLVFILFTI